MDTPRLARRVVVLMLVVAALAAVPAPAGAQKLVFLVRHAERADGGAGVGAAMAGGGAPDPLLSPAGEARAKRLAAMLADSGIKVIYATEFKRTQDTGRPLATRLGIQVRQNPSLMHDALAARLKSEHANDVVLVIGHSNTLPPLIKALGGPDVHIPDQDYDSLFVFVPATRVVTRLRY
jgi:broad specificity phosphatase PhoE